MEGKFARLKLFREHLGFTQEKLANIFGVERSTYGKIEAGKYDIPLKYVEILHAKYNLNPTWLFTGEENMQRNKTHSGNIVSIDNDKTLPVINKDKFAHILEMRAIAGNPLKNYLDFFFQEAKLFPRLTFRMQLYIQIEGDSMEPTLKDGDIFAITMVYPSEIIDGKIYVIHTTDGEVLIKRIILDRQQKVYMLTSDNKHKYLPFIKQEHEIHLLFKVTGQFLPLELDDYDDNSL